MTAASAQDRTTAPALSAAPDPAAFREPPADTRPNTLYFWMNGNVTREGIDADLTAMRDIGLGGALMFDGSNDVPKGPVNYISPHWLDLMRSKEHTSELQSLMRISYAVFCLNTKKKTKTTRKKKM